MITIGYNVKSLFIRNLIKDHNYYNYVFRDYVYDLIRLEEFIMCGGPNSFSSSMVFHSLKSSYRFEYEVLLKELKPGEYEEYLYSIKEEKEKNNLLEVARCRKDKEIKERDIKQWKLLGGSVDYEYIGVFLNCVRHPNKSYIYGFDFKLLDGSVKRLWIYKDKAMMLLNELNLVSGVRVRVIFTVDDCIIFKT